jgi:hypothetical protein
VNSVFGGRGPRVSQVSADVVDWEWLAAVPDARSRVDALLGSDEAASHVERCTDLVENWNYSGLLWFDAGDALDTLIAEADPQTASRVRQAFSPLVSIEDDAAIDELDLSSASGGCFYASLSPATTVAAVRAMDGIDLAAIARELDPTRQAEFEEYLAQWAVVIRRASERGMGIVAHQG